MLRRKFLTAALAAVAALSAPSKAEAAFTVAITVGSSPTQYFTEGPSGVQGQTTIGAYTITVNAKWTQNTVANPNTEILQDLTTNVTTTTSTAETITIVALNDDVNIGSYNPRRIRLQCKK